MYQIIVQRAVSNISIPSTPLFKRWAKGALEEKIPNAELTIRVVDEDEMRSLNSTYRKKDKTTNVLSFPFDTPEDVDVDLPLLGDIVICAQVIIDEAKEQHKTVDAHWAHMIVHGVLHLLGYDHEKDDEAEMMEAEEIKILKKLGFDNPYQIHVTEKGK